MFFLGFLDYALDILRCRLGVVVACGSLDRIHLTHRCRGDAFRNMFFYEIQKIYVRVQYRDKSSS